MNFYETLISGFVGRARAMAGLSEEEEHALMLDLMKESCCRAMQEIREVLNDESLDDRQCFCQIEKIVDIYEKVGSNGGTRHRSGELAAE